MTPVRLIYDADADAAYFDLRGDGADSVPSIEPRVAKTYLCDPIEVGGIINLDFNGEGQLIGVEVLDASTKLPRSLMSGP